MRLINGEIVSVARYGKLTVLNKKLEILKTLDGSESEIRSLAGNDKLIAFGDYSGAVRYYNLAGDLAQKVS